MTTPTPPQPNTGDERLREKISQDIIDYGPGCVAALYGPFTKDPEKEAADTFETMLDAIMQAVKAELGAARLDELRQLKDVTKIGDNWMNRLNDRIKELRNHFGIGEASDE